MIKLPLYDKRMLMLLEYCVLNAIAKTEKEFLLSIGYANTNNVTAVRKGKQSFRVEHFMKACEVYGADANFFLNKSHTSMFKPGKKISAAAELKQATARVLMELNGKLA